MPEATLIRLVDAHDRIIWINFDQIVAIRPTMQATAQGAGTSPRPGYSDIVLINSAILMTGEPDDVLQMLVKLLEQNDPAPVVPEAEKEDLTGSL